MGVDLLDMAVAFDEEQVVDFFDLDAAADEAKDDLFDVEIFPFFHGVYKVHGVVIGVYLDIRGFVLVISLYGCFHDFQLVL